MTAVRTIIDSVEALQLLEKAVEMRGRDYSYPINVNPVGPECRYWHQEDASPGCIVGLALSLAGVKADVLDKLDHHILPVISSPRAREALESEGYELTDRAVQVFSAAQRQQDGGASWAIALAAAQTAVFSDNHRSHR